MWIWFVASLVLLISCLNGYASWNIGLEGRSWLRQVADFSIGFFLWPLALVVILCFFLVFWDLIVYDEEDAEQVREWLKDEQ